MLFYFIAAVRTSAIKYSTITVQRKYVGGDMSICRGNRQYSTIFGLINVADNIYDHLDEGNYIIGIYLDLQKAFDTINVVKRHFTTSYTHPNPYPSLSQYTVAYVPNLVRKSFPCAK